MKKHVIVALICAIGAGRAARAEVLADGSYAPTGNAAVDGALAVVNLMNREIKDQQDLQQVFIQRIKLEKSLDERLDSLRASATKIHALRAQALTEADKLKKGVAARKREAGGDAAKEKELDEAAAAREAELKQAADQLQVAEQSLKDAGGFAQQMKKTLHQVGAKGDDKQALADWEKLRPLYVAQRDKMKAKLDACGNAMSAAGALIQKGSDLDTSHEAVAAFDAKLVSTTGKKTELWIDGQKVGVGDHVALSGPKLELRAVLVDPRRKQSREIKTQHVTLEKATDYELVYSLGSRKSSWKVTEEKYEWKEPDTRTGAKLITARSSSGKIAKDDVLEITFSGDTASETIRGAVDGSIEWHNGPTEETDSESAGFEIAISPAH